jgi:hypothetical protein
MIKGKTMTKTDRQERVDDGRPLKTGEVDLPSGSIKPPDTSGSLPPSSPASFANDLVPAAGAFSQPRDHRRRLVRKALLDIYGPNGPDLGESEDMCHQKVNSWILNRGMAVVSKATLRRAKRELRKGLTPERG